MLRVSRKTVNIIEELNHGKKETKNDNKKREKKTEIKKIFA